jgi:zinc transporter
MTGFAYRIIDCQAERVDLSEALEGEPQMVWAHLATTDERAQAWFRDHAGLSDYVVEALTAFETRPRCEAFDRGALLNLRGRSDVELSASDPLASIRLWAVKGHVFSATRRPLAALATVQKEVEQGAIHDPGDLITAFASAITADLDPVVADLGDELDECEEHFDVNRLFDLRRTVTRCGRRRSAIDALSIPSDPHSRRLLVCPVTGLAPTTGSICPPPPTGPHAWRRS